MLEQILDIQTKALDGFSNPLEAYIELKRIADMATAAMKEIKPEAIEEAEKHGKGEHEISGCKVQVKNGAGRWSFKDLDWYKEYKTKEKLAKESYDLLQKGVQMVTEDGEVVAPAKYTQGSQVLTIKF